MNKKELIEKLIEKSKKRNIEDIEVYIKKSSSMECNIYEGSLEKYFVSDEEDLSLRGIYNGKMGYSYTEKFTVESIEELLNNLIQYAENNDNACIERLAEPWENKLEPMEKENCLDKYSEEEKIQYLLDLEKRAYAVDKQVKSISNCSYREITENIYIKNTKGLELEDFYTMGSINLGVVTEKDNNMQSGYSHCLFSDLSEKYKDELIKESVGDALSMLGAKSIKPGKFKVVLRNNVVADMISYFTPIFFANQVQRGLSSMKGKIGKKVAVDFLNIVENPLMKNGKYHRTFDDEGSITDKKYIIKDGSLKTFLHNRKTARKEGVESTGNGFRTSHKSSIEVMATNMYIEKGDKSLKDILKIMDNGIVITDIHGLHAGINPTSGDFSLSSNGFVVENGEKVRPLTQITVAGNLYTMLMDIEVIGDDIKFCHPNLNYFGSPSLLIRSLNISGK